MAAIVSKTIDMDLAVRGITPVVHAVQGDVNRVLYVNFFENKTPYNVEGLSYTIQYSKPDGTGGSYDTLPDGTAAGTLFGTTGGFSLAPQVLTVPGIVKINVALINSQRTIHTFSVTIDVEKNPGYGFESDDYVNIGGVQRVYDLDLREYVKTVAEIVNLTGKVDHGAIMDAVENGYAVRARLGDASNTAIVYNRVRKYLGDDGMTSKVVLDCITEGAAVNGIDRYSLSVTADECYYHHYTDISYRRVKDLFVESTGWDPNKYLGTDAEGNVVAVDAPEGGGSEKLAKDIRVAKSESTITLTTTLEDDTQSVTDIALDENGYPVTVTTDGNVCSVGWEGF